MMLRGDKTKVNSKMSIKRGTAESTEHRAEYKSDQG